MNNFVSIVESILFVASKPLSIQKIAKALSVSDEEVEQVVQDLIHIYSNERGLWVVRSGETVQMITNPLYTSSVEQFTKNEIVGELTRAQLETLTVVAYRGPMTRPELEEIRGVNCSIILRNLLMRGLVEEKEQKESVLSTYELSIDALRFLGISEVKELPDYDALRHHAHLEQESDNTSSENEKTL
ncbi:MAG: SMC-Scp complex subunit ScpB [Candidatus Magasanikbacteria bacterium]